MNGSTAAGSYTIDGAYAPSTVPNPDAITEFKIQTSQYDASYGAMVPSTNVIMRGGESHYHGTAWEFVRNDIFNANAFFRNATGQPKPNLKQNQFGVTLGGPIRKDKWFFFGSYQGTRQVNGLDPTSVATVILPPLTNDRSAGTLAAEFCPGNHLLTSGPGAGQPDPRYLTFAGGKQLDCANQSTATTAPISPVALSILQAKLPDGTYMIPVPQTILPSGSNAGMGFSSFSFPSMYNEDHLLANSDYVASASTRFVAGIFLTHQPAPISRGAGWGDGHPGDSGRGRSPGAPCPGRGALRQAHFRSDLRDRERSALCLHAHPSAGARRGHAPGGLLRNDRGGPAVPYPPEVTLLGPMGTFRFFGNGANDFSTLTNTSIGRTLFRWCTEGTTRAWAECFSPNTTTAWIPATLAGK